MTPTIEEIHESLVNGQRKQMVAQIDEYGAYDFWSDYLGYINENRINIGFFTDATIAYFSIKNR